MPHIPKYWQVSTNSKAEPRAEVRLGAARFTVLFDRLIRMEHAPDQMFEDRPSLAFWHRQTDPPQFSVKYPENDRMTIETAALKLHYRETRLGFTPETLEIEIKESGRRWRFGDNNPGNLGGTVRTVDGKDGPVPLPPGLLSRSGWSVVDDSGMPVLNQESWVENRGNNHPDLYFFGYGIEYRQCLQDFLALSGQIPMIPRWALGNWWSRYWEYTQQELWKLMLRFQQEDIPLAVCVIDMDWHLVKNNQGRRGWTGYTWNRELFPDVEQFLADMHQRMNLRISLNLHPHDGVWPHEQQYQAMAAHMEVDPASRQGIAFDIADPRYAEGYFRLLHHPHEEIGVDLWWMDWQQGESTAIHKLDPLWWLNHLHYLDSGRDGRKRPLGFSRWAGYGNQRYPIGFSGDAVVSWQSLAFQPAMTATAANVGCTWWSHDIGGHFHGMEEPELFTRWIQFGVFSPINRMHCSKDPNRDRHPWGKGVETLAITREFLQLRHRLVPYLYSEARLCSQEGHALCRPMYHEHADAEEAYWCPQQYMFGSQMLVAPFVERRDPDTTMSRQTVWLPPGQWYDFFSGEALHGDQWHAIYGSLEEIPVFVRAGAILPLARCHQNNRTGNPEQMELRLFAGADGEYEMYEDDGDSMAWRDGQSVTTRIRQIWREHSLTIKIGPPQGNSGNCPGQRSWCLLIGGIGRPETIAVLSDRDQLTEAVSSYDQETERLRLEIPAQPGNHALEIKLKNRAGLGSRRDRTLEKCRRMLYRFLIPAALKNRIGQALQPNVDNQSLITAAAPPSVKRCLTETCFKAGIHYVDCLADNPFLVVWNNQGGENTHYHYCRRDQGNMVVEPAPKFTVIPTHLPAESALQPPARLSNRAVWSLILLRENMVMARIDNPQPPSP